MICVADPTREDDSALLHAPGGFLWWYLDLVDGEGSGLVLIWSYGLPFLPGYASAHRNGQAQAPATRPSLNVALYERGKLTCYVLQEYSPDSVAWQPEAGVWTFGGTRIRSWLEQDYRRVLAELDCPLPGTHERLTGKIEVGGVARRSRASDLPSDPDHVWIPMTGPARGIADLSVGGRWRFRMEGRAYHDRNGSRKALHALGIRDWTWGRAPFSDHERIYYLLWPQDPDAAPRAMGLTIDTQGATRLEEGLEMRLSGRRRSVYGPTWWSRIELLKEGQPWLSLRQMRLVENGPFYLRLLTEATLPDGELARGWGEVVIPARVDLARHRPFVRMRVHDLDGRNSILLPLFSGPRAGRPARLLSPLRPAFPRLSG